MKLTGCKNCKFGGIYCIINKVNWHRYIGQAKNIYIRLKEHLRSTFHDDRSDYTVPIHSAIRKYGLDNFEVEVLEKCEGEDLLNEREIYWIAYYHTFKEDPK